MTRSSYREQDYAFGQRMLTLRTAVGLTQRGLAEFLHVSRQTVSGWEAGQSYPKPDHLQQLIELVVQRRAFNTGREAEDIRALWHAARQKVLLDEQWLQALLDQQTLPDNPPPAPAPFHARPLPIVSTPCIGRETELTQIAGLLADPACRVLTICGPGGIGKTRLALEVATRQTALFKHGGVFVELASVSAANQIIPTIGEALRLSFVGQDEPLEHLLRYLQPLDLLLVLDNLEHLQRRLRSKSCKRGHRRKSPTLETLCTFWVASIPRRTLAILITPGSTQPPASAPAYGRNCSVTPRCR